MESQRSSISAGHFKKENQLTFQYRKKPVVIEAYQFEDPSDGMTTRAWPAWFLSAIASGAIANVDGAWYVQTLETGKLAPKHLITDGDFIIRGVQGELYPCKPDIFAATYDKVEPNWEENPNETRERQAHEDYTGQKVVTDSEKEKAYWRERNAQFMGGKGDEVWD
jgi:hypothetical protein